RSAGRSSYCTTCPPAPWAGCASSSTAYSITAAASGRSSHPNACRSAAARWSASSTPTSPPDSVRGDAGRLDDAPPALGVLAEPGAELLRRARLHERAELLQALAGLRLRER